MLTVLPDLFLIWKVQRQMIADIFALADALGVDMLRHNPQAQDMASVVEHFDLARRSPLPPPRRGAVNGYWHGQPGKPGLPAG